MAKTVQAIYENGVLKPLRKLNLRNHARVKVRLETLPVMVKKTGLKSDPINKLCGIIKEDIQNKTDLSVNHDKYIYGE